MSRMAEIAMDLDNLETMIYEHGLGDAEVQSEMNRLCKIGFSDEVQVIVWEFSEFINGTGLDD